MRRRVLMIANDFPPIGGAGVQRTVYFARYLPEFDWNPVVLTVKDVAFPAKDPSLLDELPPAVEVTRTETLELRRLAYLANRLRGDGRGGDVEAMPETGGAPGDRPDPAWRELARTARRWAFVPDDRMGWAPFAVLRALRIARDRDVRLIYATVPCYSSGVIGGLLSWWTGLPLVLDLRDPWTRDPYLPSPTRAHAALNRRLEAAVVERASRVVVISPAMRRRFAEAYPGLGDRLVTITNGYDAARFAGVAAAVEEGRFVVAYVGSLYAHHRDALRAVLRAWTAAAEADERFATDSVLRLVGRRDPEIDEELAAWPLVRSEPKGYRPHAVGIAELKGADALLLLIKDLDPEHDLITIPGKLFEYLAAGPTVLMVGPPGDAADLVAAAGGDVHAEGDTSGIAAALAREHAAWAEGRRRTRASLGEAYERRALTRRLAATFDDAATG